MKALKIGDREISRACKPYIIAELSANHNGSLEKALKLVELAAKAGADAIKLQTYTADTMTIDSDADDFKITGGLWDGYTLYELYEEAHTPWEWHEAIMKKAASFGIDCFSSPFDETAVDFLESLNVPAYKVASFEMTDLPLVEKIASTGKPVVVSTGMASFDEIQETVETIRKFHDNIILLHCVSAYPTPHTEQNISTVSLLEQEFGCIAGLSDHTMSNSSAIAAVAMGACLIEKHFIESRQDKGPDSEFSLEPPELEDLVVRTREAWESIGKASFDLKEAESGNKRFRRSIYFIDDVKAGDKISLDNVKRIRPGFGLEPKYFGQVLGRTVSQDVSRGTPLSWDLLAPEDA